jgi:hypothetical protein
MGIFDFLKPNKTEKKISEPKKPEVNITESKKLESIFDLFDSDLKSLPGNSFVKGNEETNESGNKIINYRKDLNPMELGLFDTLEIKTFENLKNKNFIFSNFNFSKSQIEKIKYFVDKVYLLYGIDSSQKGKFTNSDSEEFDDNFWLGRRWTEDHHKPPISISYDEDYGLSLTVWLS